MKDDPSVIAARKADQLQRYIGALEEKSGVFEKGRCPDGRTCHHCRCVEAFGLVIPKF